MPARGRTNRWGLAWFGLARDGQQVGGRGWRVARCSVHARPPVGAAGILGRRSAGLALQANTAAWLRSGAGACCKGGWGAP